MSDDRIAELEAELKELKRQRRSAAARERALRVKPWLALADPAVRAKISAARKAALAAKFEREAAPRQSRRTGTKSEVPRVPSLAGLLVA